MVPYDSFALIGLGLYGGALYSQEVGDRGQCLDAFRDAHGNPGQHKVPVYDTAMIREKALKVLREIQERRPDDEFSMRPITNVCVTRGNKL